MSRTNIVLDDKLVKEAMGLADVRTKREMVNQALTEFVQRRKQRGLLELFGKGLIDPKYDYKAARVGKTK